MLLICTAECAKCLAGQYAAGSGSLECTQCPPGKYSSFVGSTVCTQCDEGSYTGKGGESACQSCTAGGLQRVAPYKGMSMCADCDPNAKSRGTE